MSTPVFEGRFRDKVVVVTGAAQGIGLAVASRVVSEGGEVLFVDRAEIVRLATADPRLKDVHQLRTRTSGPFIHIQMHAAFDPDMTLEAAHEVILAAEHRILEAFPAADIIIHADPRGKARPHGGAFAESTGSDPAEQTK